MKKTIGIEDLDQSGKYFPYEVRNLCFLAFYMLLQDERKGEEANPIGRVYKMTRIDVCVCVYVTIFLTKVIHSCENVDRFFSSSCPLRGLRHPHALRSSPRSRSDLLSLSSVSHTVF